MADRNERQARKNDLRQRIVEPQSEEKKAGRRPSLRLILILIICVLGAAAVFIGYFWNTHYTAYDVVWEKRSAAENGSNGAFKGYELFSGGIINYSKDGASYADKNGEAIWERSYQMNDPKAVVNGSYAAIADIGGTAVHIFDDKTNTGSVSTSYPIVDISISAEGVLYTVLTDGSAEYLTAFRADGSAIDLLVKSLITEDGFPIDIAASPNGSQLITAYVTIDGSAVKSQVIFRNFDDIGQNADARRIVGGFIDEFKDRYVGRVNFSSEDHAQAFFDGGIAFFSTKVLTSPELIGWADFAAEIVSIACSEKYCAVILHDPTAEQPYRLSVFSTEGGVVGEAGFDLQYDAFEIDGEDIYIYNDTELYIFSPKGREKAHIESDELRFSKIKRTGLLSEYMVADGNDYIGIKLR